VAAIILDWAGSRFGKRRMIEQGIFMGLVEQGAHDSVSPQACMDILPHGWSALVLFPIKRPQRRSLMLSLRFKNRINSVRIGLRRGFETTSIHWGPYKRFFQVLQYQIQPTRMEIGDP